MRHRLVPPLVLLLAAAPIACSEDAVAPPADPVPTSLRLSETAVALAITQTRELAATVLDQNGAPMEPPPAGFSVTWISSDTTRVAIDEAGVARGVQIGAATITARAGGLEASLTATVLAPQINVDAARTASATIGPGGGTIETVGASGIRYRLELPPMAVTEPTTISITPVIGFGNAPFLSNVAGVRFAPDGLQLLAPARLTMELPTASADLRGIYFSDDGGTLTNWIAHVSGDMVTIPVPGFSGVGAAEIEEEGSLPTSSPVTDDPDSWDYIVMLGDVVAQSTPDLDVGKMIDVYRLWYEELVRPNLVVASTVEDVTAAIADWRAWLDLMLAIPEVAAELIAGLGDEIDDARGHARAALIVGIDRANGECIVESNYAFALPVLILHSFAHEYGLDGPGSGLDEATLLAEFCVKVYIVDLEFPDEIQPDVPAQLVVRPGIGYGEGAPVESESIRTRITATGTTDDTPSSSTDPEVVRTVVPTGDRPLRLEIESCFSFDPIEGYPLDLSKICDRASITAGFFEYFQNFDQGTPGPEWSRRVASRSPSGERFLGPFNNVSLTLTLGDLPEHEEVTIEFDFYVIDSWSGSAGSTPDMVEFSTAGSVLLRTTFANHFDRMQAYPGNYPGSTHPAGTGSSATHSLGYDGRTSRWGDSTYPIRFTIPHTGETFQFTVRGISLSDEEVWGLDNVRVTMR
jgi:hypothetical protein